MKWTVDATRVERVTVEVEADTADEAWNLAATAADESTDWTAFGASIDSLEPAGCSPEFGGLVSSERGI